MPRWNGRRLTWAPRAAASTAVRSVEPSETTTTSSPGSSARSSSSTRPTLRSSLKAGTIAIRLTVASGAAGAAGALSTSVDTGLHSDADELEQPARAMAIGVLVEHALARATAELLRLAGIVEQVAVGGDGFVRVMDDEQLAARLEPALDPFVRVRDDRRGTRRQLERPRRRRRVHARVRAAREAEIDARRRDRAREDVERHVAGETRAPGVALEVAPAEREVDVGQRARGLADERSHPVAPELVAVAVEVDVDLLVDLLRREEVGIGTPEDSLRAPCAELEQSLEAAFGVRDDEVVFARIGAVVVVEARVHAAELGQAHRHVAVVEHNWNAEALAQRGRDAAEVRHRDREDDHRVRALLLDEPLEVAPPARGDEPPDRLARDAVERRVLGALLRPAQVAVAAEPREQVARGGVRLAFAVGRVRGGAPPRRLA